MLRQLTRAYGSAARRLGQLQARRSASHGNGEGPLTVSGGAPKDKAIIGNREIVSHGCNGLAIYNDDENYPFPAIRYKEPDPDIAALREKERGDWRDLSIEEKKCLYRASFCQTFAEFAYAPDTHWKSTVGSVLIGLACSLWLFMYYLDHIVNPLPDSFRPEARIAQYNRMVDLNIAPFQKIPVPPGAEPRVHPKNAEMLKQLLNQVP
ncbi:hypothetical protein TKK_0017827 [Trichogramma kaykai]|uniref:Cytochrome c oxidase subunit 4 n=1 Tax=Trichogramma kaykai TaxID=54128 RepID=A0ABD2W1I4_9HYME